METENKELSANDYLWQRKTALSANNYLWQQKTALSANICIAAENSVVCQ